MAKTAIELAKAKAEEALFVTEHELRQAREAVAVAEGRVRLAEDMVFTIETIERDCAKTEAPRDGEDEMTEKKEN